MGRRSLPNTPLDKLTYQDARLAVAQHLRKLKGGLNMAQLRAQTHEEGMVDLLATMARNGDVPYAIRRQCAVDVITFARGNPKPWLHDGKSIDPGSLGETGNTIADEIEAAKHTTSLWKQIDWLRANNVPPAQWPEDVRQVAGDLIEVYGDEG